LTLGFSEADIAALVEDGVVYDTHRAKAAELSK